MLKFYKTFSLAAFIALCQCPLFAVTISVQNNDIFATSSSKQFVHINPVTGAITTLLELPGVDFRGGITRTPSGVLYLGAVESGQRTIYSVTLQNNSTITYNKLPLTLTSYARRLTIGTDGNLYGVTLNGSVVKIDLLLNSVTPVTFNSSIGNAFDIQAETSGGTFIVTDSSGDRVLRVNPTTGDVSVLSSGGFLSTGVTGVSVDPITNDIYVLDQVPDNLVKIDPLTGAQTLVLNSSKFNTGRTIDAYNNQAVIDSPLLNVDLTNGNSTDIPASVATIEELTTWQNGSLTVIVPEPSSIALLITGGMAAFGFIQLTRRGNPGPRSRGACPVFSVAHSPGNR